VGKGSRDKGGRIERELVARHKAIGIHAERYPLSGATRFRGKGHDVDVYVFGLEETPLVCDRKPAKTAPASPRWKSGSANTTHCSSVATTMSR
jgi:hypothetical protein